jgi:hypothetical protein
MSVSKAWSDLSPEDQAYQQRLMARDLLGTKETSWDNTPSELLIMVRDRLVAELQSGFVGMQFLCHTARYGVKSSQCVEAVHDALLLDNVNPSGSGFHFDAGEREIIRIGQAQTRTDLIRLDALGNLRRWIWLSLMIQYFKAQEQAHEAAQG